MMCLAQKRLMNDDMIEKYIIISLIPGLGVISQNRLLKLCGGVEECFQISQDELMRRDNMVSSNRRIGAGKITKFCSLRMSKDIRDNAQRILDSCKEKRIHIVTCEDSRYPARFKMLNDMPVVLYVKGSLEINEHKRSVGIIGARRCSTEGKKAAVVITEREIRSDSVIVSGMAKGIDSYAHTASIKNQAYTIAVLGNGPDICYPREHERLYEEIVMHGCIASEYPPGMEPKKYYFPKRNRLIAALSDMVYVIDTGRKSGTLSTVAACRKYNRNVRMIDVAQTEGVYTTGSMTDAEDCGNT